MLRHWGVLIATLLMGLALAVLAITPPSPRAADSSPAKFSADRAMVDVQVIAEKPHVTGSAENAKVRAYLLSRLEALGLETYETQAQLPKGPLARLNRWRGTTDSEQIFTNIIGIRRGSDNSKPALLLMAHHDTVWESPGAADDTIGIASILEIIRALNTGPKSERDLIVLFTDAEEIGLVGAKHFFKNNPLKDKIGAILNFEARGGGGTANMFQTSTFNGNAVRFYAKTVKAPSASSLSVYVYNVLPNDTDLTPALEKAYVAFNIANIGRAEYYHSPKITTEALQVSTVQHMGSQGLDLTRGILALETLPKPRKDATFFDFFGFFTIVYTPAWGWLFLAIAAVFSVLTIDTRSTRKDILTGSARIGGLFILGSSLLFGLNLLSGASSGYYDRLAAIPKLEVMVGFAGIALFFGLFGRGVLSRNSQIGLGIPLLILGIAGQAIAPTATYFISLPVMIYALTIFLLRGSEKQSFRPWIVAVLSALVFGYMLGLYHLLMLGVGPDMPSVAILPFALMTLAIVPLFPGVGKRTSWTIAFIGIALSVLTALWIRLDPIATTVPLY